MRRGAEDVYQMSDGNANPELSIIIVSWNVKDLLKRCLESIFDSDYAGEPGRLEVIVVDNASSDGSAEMVLSDFPQVRLLENSQNLGFTRANNQGIEVAGGRFVFFLNPDAEIVGDALGTMVEFMESHPEVGALGPRLLYPDGSIQSSRRRFPGVATLFLESTLIQRWWKRNKILSRYYMEDRSPEETQEVDWLVGAAIMARREVLDQVGGFDEGFFMYSEELDWCRRAKDAGWKIVYLPTAAIIHHEGKSSGQVVAARNIHFFTSRVRYAEKYHGKAVAEVLRLFLLGTFLFQMGEEWSKWAVGHKRPLRESRIRAYREVLRSGLRPG